MNIVRIKEPNGKYKPWNKKFIMRPENIVSVCWEIFMTAVLLMIAILVPYSTAFESTNDTLSSNVDIFSVTVFSIDIIFNFSTGYYQQGILIMDRKKIARNYLKLWFWIDFFSTIPFGLILNYASQSYTSSSQMLGFLKLLRELKLFKLVKLARLKVLISRIEDHMSNEKLVSLVTIIKLLFYLFLIAHVFACIMFSVSLGDLSPNTMIYQMATKSEEILESNTEFYITSLYWAFVTMASIGFGDISPQSINERIFGVVAMLTTSAIFGVIIGNIGSLTERYNIKETVRRDALLEINSFMKKHNLLGRLRYKVQRYIDFAFRNDKLLESNIETVLCHLPDNLQEEIFLYTNGNAIKRCMAFKIFTVASIYRISQLMRVKIFSPMDHIIHENNSPLGKFFITHGLAEVYDYATSRRITSLVDNQYFGEIGLFTGQNCVSSIISVDFTETLFLGVIEFSKFLELVPTFKADVLKIKELCTDGNYTALGVLCYSCQEIGHISKYCKAIINEDVMKQNWINRRFRTKFVGEHPILDGKQYKRIFHRAKNYHYSSKNVSGRKRHIGEMYKGFRGVIRRVKYYLREYAEEAGTIGFIHTEESALNTSTYQNQRHLEWILETEEEKDSEF